MANTKSVGKGRTNSAEVHNNTQSGRSRPRGDANTSEDCHSDAGEPKAKKIPKGECYVMENYRVDDLDKFPTLVKSWTEAYEQDAMC